LVSAPDLGGSATPTGRRTIEEVLESARRRMRRLTPTQAEHDWHSGAVVARLPIADYELQVIVLCQEGYASSLAAASLQDLGIHRATDVIGGYAAWRGL
jgi:rhodanese-related sulfurtransferase